MTKRLTLLLCTTLVVLGLVACGPVVVATCGNRLVASDTGPVQDASLVEISGIDSGRVSPGVWWVHNDSGDSARVFAIGDDGATRRVYTLTGASAVDWEDLAVGRGPIAGASYLYAGDIGDNAAARAEIVVYRVAEPAVTVGPAATLGGVDALRLQYPDGAHDAESLLVDPLTGDLVIVTKSLAGGPVGVYRAPGSLAGGSPTTLEKAGAITLPSGLANAVTGAAISPEGKQLAVRTYGGVRVYARSTSQSAAQALVQGKPCSAPPPVEAQGEAIGFDADGRGLVTISEGSAQTLHHLRTP